MNYASRITKLETQVEMNQKEFDRIHQAINELRTHFDQKLDASLKEVRREASINMRWMMGMWLTTMGLIAGLCGRMFGIY
ncbi:hypothetical protein [Duganella sp. BuS-21]|uniref:hypothetical protein n=1 Tax=Duganella sp. BuS-21 TaxID=2943848 RepID=UPI0035A66FDA